MSHLRLIQPVNRYARLSAKLFQKSDGLSPHWHYPANHRRAISPASGPTSVFKNRQQSGSAGAGRAGHITIHQPLELINYGEERGRRRSPGHLRESGWAIPNSRYRNEVATSLVRERSVTGSETGPPHGPARSQEWHTRLDPAFGQSKLAKNCGHASAKLRRTIQLYTTPGRASRAAPPYRPVWCPRFR